MSNPSTTLVTRRNFQSRWIWELLASDRHVLNSSERTFDTREECEANALENGQTFEDVRPKRGARADSGPATTPTFALSDEFGSIAMEKALSGVNIPRPPSAAPAQGETLHLPEQEKRRPARVRPPVRRITTYGGK